MEIVTSEAPLTPVRQTGESTERGAATNPGRFGLLVEIWLATIWLALITGAVEGLYWQLRQSNGGALVFMHPGYLWLSPFAHLTFFSVAGAVASLVAWFTRSRDTLPFAVTLLSLLAWLNTVQLLAPGLHFWAWLLLGCGLATATGRAFQRYSTPCRKVVRCTAVWLIVLFVSLSLADQLLARRGEQRAVAALPDSPQGAPNVLLVVLDTVRADVLDPPRAGRDAAPNLRRLAEQGVAFKSSWSTAPWTLPSQAGMFTGRLPHELSSDWLTKLDNADPTLAEELSTRGWLTGGFVGNTRYCSAETGLARGFAHYEDYELSWTSAAMCTALGRKLLCSNLPVRFGQHDWPGRKRAPQINEALAKWLAGREPGRPYFAFVNYWDAHDPYFAPSDFRTTPPSDLEDKLLLRNWWWVHKEGWSEEQLKMLRDSYEDCLRGLDHQLGQLLQQLQRQGDLDNTIIIVTADHGEHFAEHDLFLHGNSLYEPLINVPLVVVWPEKIPAGRELDDPVSLRGLPNTVCELLQLRPTFPGESWASRWKEGAGSHESAPISAEIGSQACCPPCHGRSPVAAGPMRCVRIGNAKYIRNGDATEELYDLARDPSEQCNLVTDPNYQRVLERLRSE